VPLNFSQIKTRKAGAHADGGGLYLHVRDRGARVWAFASQQRTASAVDPRRAEPAWRHRRRTNQRPLCAKSRRSQIGFADRSVQQHHAKAQVLLMLVSGKVNSTLRNHSFVALAL
jgi:hypothetical protein